MPTISIPPHINGGAPHTAAINARYLAEMGHTVRQVFPADICGFEQHNNLEIHKISSPNIYWDYRKPHPKWKKLLWHALENYNPRAEKLMAQEIADFKPDIMYSISIENVNVASWRAAKSAGIPVIHQPSSSFLLCWKSSMISKTGQSCITQCSSCKATSLGKKLMSQYVDGLIGETQFILDTHIDHGYFKNARARVVRAGIENIQGAAPRKRKTGRPFTIGFLGDLLPLKAPDILAQASHLLDSEKFKFIIGGKGEDAYVEHLKGMFAPGTAQFMGWTNPKQFYPKVDVLVLPSRGSEVFGRVIFEAYGHGIPVIGSRQGGIPESIDHEKTGFSFTSENAEELAEYLKKLYEEPELYEQMCINALNKLNEYSPDNWKSTMDEFLNEFVR